MNDIPKGSRLAVSTNLLAALISVCMRATGQAAVARPASCRSTSGGWSLARAILGEWLGGSGGGWQDSGGVWPGMKLIEGVLAGEGDPEYGISRGRLLPATPHPRTESDASPETRRKLQDSLVLVHGGMAQNVGPILEMVTEKYLLRCGGRVEGAAEHAGHPRRDPGRPAQRRRARDRRRHHAQLPRAASRPSSPGPPTTTPRR